MANLPASPPWTPTKRKISPPAPRRSAATYFSPPTSTLASTSMSSPSPAPTPSAASGPAKLPPLPTHLALPPLPAITDKELERLAFTHSSWTGRPKDRHGLDLTVETLDNEKLEHVGDSLLGCIVTLLLHQLYPNLGDGTATVLKAHLVSNATLAQISTRYGLHERFIAAPFAMSTIKNGDKSRANLFEAYIAALYASLAKERQTAASVSTPPLTPPVDKPTSPGIVSADSLGISVPAMDDGMAFMIVSNWLRGIFTPIAVWAFEQMREQRKQGHRTRQNPTPARGLGGIVSAGDAEADEDEDDSMLDGNAAMGRSAQLNEHFTRYHGKCPSYEYTANPNTFMWTCVCVAVEKNGRTFTASATRGNKKISAQIAALKICMQLGWT